MIAIVVVSAFLAPSASAEEDSAAAGKLFRQANDYFKERDYDKAAESYEECLGLDPELKEAWYNLGVVYGKLRKYKREIRAYRNAVEADPRYTRAWYNLALA